MKTLLLYTLFCSVLCLAPAAEAQLIYDENCMVNAELRCPAPDGNHELVYRGLRHKEQDSISVVHEIILVNRDGQEITLKEATNTGSIYRRNIISQPWSADGKWLVFPISQWTYCICPTDALNKQGITDKSIPLEVKEERTYALEGGQWESDGTFTFRAGLSGWLAPYRATVTPNGVHCQQTGPFVKVYPKRPE